MYIRFTVSPEILGVSQEEFADMCRLDQTYIGGIERGERNVRLLNVEKFPKHSVFLYKSGFGISGWG